MIFGITKVISKSCCKIYTCMIFKERFLIFYGLWSAVQCIVEWEIKKTFYFMYFSCGFANKCNIMTLVKSSGSILNKRTFPLPEKMIEKWF